MMQTQAVIRHISRWLADYAVRAGAAGLTAGGDFPARKKP